MVGYNPFPDEKGTESSKCVYRQVNGSLSYNPFPDEKGTESYSTHSPGARITRATRYNPFPDEKGTESHYRQVHHRWRQRVTIHSPTKRGLKDCFDR